MAFRLAGEGVLLLHAAFIAFALLGGLLVLRFGWMAAIHLPAAAWGCFIELTGGACPLTYVENYFRRRAGEAGYPGSFLEHYLLALVYPAGLTHGVQLVLAGIVVAANAAIYGLVIARRRAAPSGKT